uniref:Retrovirus-related Pol polyprotein from transposon TNT 1-94-like beta-barrel domain-containing protein n=1 Tax=Oryza nivara TaxID=4536 RepID=A0A0E0HPR4_ORYNI
MASSASWPAFGVSPEEAGKGKWYIATAATNHMTNDKSLISDLKPVADGRNIIADGNGAGLKVQGRGAVNTETVVLPAEVWYVPEIDENLVSVDQLNELGLSISIGRGVCTVTRVSDGSVVGKARRSGGVYEVEFLKFLSSSPRALAASPPSASPPPADSSEMASYPVFQSVISNLKPVTGRVVGGGNGAGLQVHGSGAVNTETVAIPDVWYVPGINCNLVSVGQLCQLGLEVSIFRVIFESISKKPEERANANVSSLSNIFISAEPGATMPRWFITEAATNHMTSDKSIFSDLKPMAGLVIDGRAGAGAGLPMHGIGAVYSWEVVLQDVWYVPGMSTYIGLVSAGQLTAIGLKTEIAGDVCTITSADGSEVGKGRMVSDGIFQVDFLRVSV